MLHHPHRLHHRTHKHSCPSRFVPNNFGIATIFLAWFSLKSVSTPAVYLPQNLSKAHEEPKNKGGTPKIVLVETSREMLLALSQNGYGPREYYGLAPIS